MANVPDHALRTAATVVLYPARGHEPAHETAVHTELGKRLAAIMGGDFGGVYDEAVHGGHLFLVPSDTIVGITEAQRLGIHSEADLFGGVVPYAFIPTKSITHPLLNPDSYAPEGWSPEFGRRVSDSVLTGITAFDLTDAQAAGERLLQFGAVRIKPVLATAGRGQLVVADRGQLRDALAQQETGRLHDCGIVLEEHLEKVKTYSVGQVRVAGIVASYVGTQRLTADNTGELVYGGSQLIVARGDFDALRHLDLSEDFKIALEKAQAYDAAASACFPGFFASRRNYDIASGLDSQGAFRCGVLEQSWRIGGASAAEVAALEVFHAEPDARVLEASTIEIFGTETDPPAGATALFRGTDPEIGPISKYVTVKAYGNR
ncbi:DUF3182 family protein [Parapusillimonas sp. SGNA-6]|nr:DUF3182 family protein [Parapusillimonas sp. SGNA-6]